MTVPLPGGIKEVEIGYSAQVRHKGSEFWVRVAVKADVSSQQDAELAGQWVVKQLDAESDRLIDYIEGA